MNKTFQVISHTHWDREWYLTFEQFRFRLVALIDNLLELLEKDDEFRIFHLDGQTIVLEDYLEIRPGEKARLERFIREGRILVGPWYLQNDEYLTSGEATVRNLQLGIAQSRQIDREMKVGYLPDQFGNISQIPQILQGFGIDNVVFGRGYDIAKHGDQEFRWEGADGTQVTAVFMPNWYNNAQRFPADPEKAYKVLRHVEKNIDKYRKTGSYLLMNGVDHLEAQENLSGILADLRKRLPGEEEILHATLEQHIAEVKRDLTNPKVQKGEMRAGDDYHILSGTLSSRVYLKQANVKALDLLEKWLEPLSVWVSGAKLGRYPDAWLQYLWKELMKNHPHDSICGCSQDPVHEHMMDRFRRVDEAGEELFRRQADLLVRQIDTFGFGCDDQLLTVLNPGMEAATLWVETGVDFLAKEGIRDFRLLDAEGNEVRYEMLKREKTRKQRLSPINLPTELPVERISFGFLADGVPGQGYSSYRIVPRSDRPVPEAAAASAQGVPPGGAVLENEHLRTVIEENGTLTVHCKATGQTYSRWMSFVDEADGGDLYVYKHVEGAETISSEAAKTDIRLRLKTDEMTQYEISLPLRIPVGLVPDGSRRTDETADVSIKATVSLARGAKELDVRVELENTVRDHRLRVRFPLPEAAAATIGGGQFDVVTRPADVGAAYKRHANSQPNWKWAAAGAEQGVALFNRGLHEYELREKGHVLDLTLLRSVGTIFGRPDPLAHENDDNPLGQCPGRHVFEFAIRPYGPEDRPGSLAGEAEAYHHGLRTIVIPANEDDWAAGRPWVQDSEITELFSRPDPNADKPRLPRVHSFLRLDGRGVVLSAVKRQHAGDLVCIRFYNGEDTAARTVLALDRPVRRAYRADLLEERTGELTVERGAVILEAGPKEIVTILVES